MKKFSFFLAALLLPLFALAQTVVPATTYSAGATVVSGGSTTLTNGTNTVVIGANAIVTFHSTTMVELKPGFSTVTGAQFYAVVGALVDTDGDGIPDAWESAHGLNPASSSDAGAATSGSSVISGLTNLLEYQLGTNPSTAKQADSTTSPVTEFNVHRPN